MMNNPSIVQKLGAMVAVFLAAFGPAWGQDKPTKTLSDFKTADEAVAYLEERNDPRSSWAVKYYRLGAPPELRGSSGLLKSDLPGVYLGMTMDQFEKLHPDASIPDLGFSWPSDSPGYMIFPTTLKEDLADLRYAWFRF